MYVSSLATVSYTILYIAMANYLFVLLNPLTSLPIPSGNHQTALRFHDSVSVLVSLVCSLDSIVDMYSMPFYCY